jgi:malonyl-CoA O-methyltransferase
LVKQRNRHADRYQDHSEVLDLVASRLLERLDLVTLEPEVVLDLGAGAGYITQTLARRYKKARILGVEPSTKLVKQATKTRGWFSKQHYFSAWVEQLPLADNSVDLVISHLFPIYATDLRLLFKEAARILKPDGLLLFDSLGPDTMDRVLHAWETADPDQQHGLNFLDMHDVGDALTQSGFHSIVMENEPLTIEYSSPAELHDDLRYTAQANLHPERSRTLLGKNRYKEYLTALQPDPAQPIPLCLDLIYGHGWKGYQKPKHSINAIEMPENQIPARQVD